MNAPTREVNFKIWADGLSVQSGVVFNFLGHKTV